MFDMEKDDLIKLEQNPKRRSWKNRESKHEHTEIKVVSLSLSRGFNKLNLFKLNLYVFVLLDGACVSTFSRLEMGMAINFNLLNARL